jgi:hypothetical protein
MAVTNAALRSQIAKGQAAQAQLARMAGRGSMVSSAGIASAQIIGWDQCEKALRALAAMGAVSGYTAFVGTDLVDPPYPFFLEYGTSKMPAYPAARPAWDEMGDTAVKTAGDYMGQLIEAGERNPDRVFSVALKEGSRHIENRWKELARYKTGQYKRSIHTEVKPGVEP